MGSAAAKCSFGRVIPGTEHVRGGRDGFIRSLIDNVAGPHTTKYTPPRPRRSKPHPLADAQNTDIGAASAPTGPQPASDQNGGYFSTARELGGIQNVMLEAA
jgi:hypothetical protein